jgi:hypothetical protein
LIVVFGGLQVEGNQDRMIKGRMKTGNRCLMMYNGAGTYLVSMGLVTNSCILVVVL